MCSERIVNLRGVGKAYSRYGSDADRLKELVLRRPQGDEFWALRDVDLELYRGEALGIVGRNGSGKSTLLQLICGTLKPSCGDIAVHGRIAALLELGAGFNPDFTGRENVELNASLLGLSSAEIAARLPAIKAFAGIGHFIELPVRQYSSGMYARLAFAVCAHVDADILIVDEILTVGDAEFQQRCMRFLHGFRQRGTLLFVSHDEGAVLSLCERAVWLDRGKVLSDGPSKEICRNYLASTGGGRRTGRAAAQAEGHVMTAAASRPPDPPTLDSDPGEIFAVDPDADWREQGGVTIEDIAFYHPNGERLSWAHGGELVELRIDCRAQERLTQPIVGFLLRNPRGLNLFSETTYSAGPGASPVFEAGSAFVASFHFQLPMLPSGNYCVEAMVLTGTPQRYEMRARTIGRYFLHVLSTHISPGSVANAVSAPGYIDVTSATSPISGARVSGMFDVL